MINIEMHNTDTAPDGTAAALNQVEKQLGFIPNLFRTLASSPSTLRGFMALMDANDSTSFSAAEQQIIQLAASMENQCSYCIAGHSAFAQNVGVNPDIITAIRQNRPLPNARYHALFEFSREMIRQRGRVSASDCRQFLAAGFTQTQMLEVVLGIAVKTISNYAFGLFDFPLDAQFQPHAWSAVNEAGAA